MIIERIKKKDKFFEYQKLLLPCTKVMSPTENAWYTKIITSYLLRITDSVSSQQCKKQITLSLQC